MINWLFEWYLFLFLFQRELPFKKGDIILVKRRINDDWLEGEYQGKTGIFPVNHVELFPYETTEGEAIVKYDFLPQNTSELQLRKVCYFSIHLKIQSVFFFLSRVIGSFYYVKLRVIGMKDDWIIWKESSQEIMSKYYVNQKVIHWLEFNLI